MTRGLGSQLLEHLAPELRGALANEPELDARLAALVEDARTAWPDIAVPQSQFIAAIAASLPEPSLAALDRLRAGDMLLACAARNGDARAIRAVEQQLGKLDAIIRAVGLAPHEVDDVKQQLRERLFVDDGARRAKLASYAGRGPLEHWLRIVAVRYAREWRTTQHQRDHLVETFISSLQIPAGSDPEIEHIRERYGTVFRDALAAAIASLDDDDRDVIRQVVEGASRAALGDALGVHRTTAMRRFERARQQLRDGLRSQLVQRLAIDRFAADSLMRLYDAGFRLDLATMLEEP